MSIEFLPLRTGLRLDLSHGEFPTCVYAWSGGVLRLAGDATHYGMAIDGIAHVTTDQNDDSFHLSPGMFFVAPGTVSVEGGVGLVISRLGYRGLSQIGGPIENTGRLVYIDGCSDTLLVCPPRLGEPCLNHLHLPPGTEQSAHTHPSERIGVIVRGSGECRTPSGTYPLKAGMAWRIPAGCLHSFFTGAESMDVIAWHPDSDFGPTDDDHPMKNRTFIA